VKALLFAKLFKKNSVTEREARNKYLLNLLTASPQAVKSLPTATYPLNRELSDIKHYAQSNALRKRKLSLWRAS
jgi:hypothetical protein